VTEPAQPDGAAKVAGIFGFLADRDFHGYSPLYEHLARKISTDDEIPVLVTRANQRSHAPVLFFACVHDIVLREPESPLASCYAAAASGDPASTDVWPVFRELVLSRADELSSMLATRHVQTNEVGRSAAILPALCALGLLDDRPIGLVELGASAGLNLLLDRYRIDYVPIGTVGPLDSPVHLECDLRGTRRPPLDRPAPRIVSRLGIDRSPVDVRDDDAVRWLRACIWPDIAVRAERLDAALGTARAKPPELWKGDLVDRVEDAVASVPADALPCLVSTWVLAYLSPDDRRELHARVEAIAARRPVAYITAEYEVTVPWLDPVGRRPGLDNGEVPTRLGLSLWDGHDAQHRNLAWMHAHARWLEWIDES
jgi:hypothetical protein